MEGRKAQTNPPNFSAVTEKAQPCRTLTRAERLYRLTAEPSIIN